MTAIAFAALIGWLIGASGHPKSIRTGLVRSRELIKVMRKDES